MCREYFQRLLVTTILLNESKIEGAAYWNKAPLCWPNNNVRLGVRLHFVRYNFKYLLLTEVH